MIARYTRKGFTLIEILIVVIILGILAAIVIPQFSSASQDARKSSLASTAQTLRSQVALYRLQHNDVLPDQATFWHLMTTKTDALGADWAAGAATGPFGPYMQSIPFNPLAGGALWQSDVGNGVAGVQGTAVGFVYDYAAGNGSGNIWGTDSTGKLTVN